MKFHEFQLFYKNNFLKYFLFLKIILEQYVQKSNGL